MIRMKIITFWKHDNKSGKIPPFAKLVNKMVRNLSRDSKNKRFHNALIFHGKENALS